MEVDTSAHGIPHNPHITLDSTVLIVVYYRQRALINLYVVFIHYLLPELVVQRPQFGADGSKPVVYRRIAQDNTQLLVFLYLSVEWKMIYVLVDQDVCQQALRGHPFGDYHFRQRGYLECLPIRILHLKAALENELMASYPFDVHLCWPNCNSVCILDSYLNIVRIVLHSFGIYVGDNDWEIGVDRLADFALMRLDFNDLGVLFLH